MATETAHIILKKNGRVLKVVRSGDVSNLAPIDSIANPWGGRTAMVRRSPAPFFKKNNLNTFWGWCAVVKTAGASTLGRGDGDSWKHRPHHRQDEHFKEIS
jgi:hypothetical protein